MLERDNTCAFCNGDGNPFVGRCTCPTGSGAIPPVLSVSQVEDFDSEQLGGCPRRWWFERVQGHRVESTTAHEDGHQGHALLARYLATGERPGRVRLGKAVNAVIDSGVLPAPGSDLRVEERFSLQDHRDVHGQWVPLDVRRTLWHAGHPWEGFIDLRWRSGSTVTVWDHKFSSDIHARALPAERLIRTVQMPIYALDSLRRWPDATVFNLVHLYVSRRGVESFVRQQAVTAEQVRERAEEIGGLVRQMDAVRGVTVQDEVPFNRAACHARTGCPHQFRCNAFKRRNTMMDLTDEEKAMFGLLSEEKPAAVEHPRGAYTQEMTEEFSEEQAKIQREIDAQPAPAADPNLDDIFASPAASTPKPQPAPTCEACGEVLTPENSSRLKTGDVKHIGCAEAKPPVTFETLAEGVAERLADSPLAVQAAAQSKCPDCPHPAHAGKPCEGKRGRGACRCGAAVEQPQRPQPPVPPFTGDTASDQEREELARAENDARSRINAQEAETDRVLAARAEQAKREEAPDANCITNPDGGCVGGALVGKACMHDPLPPAPPTGSWSGTLAVNVTVELGPATLALIQALVKR